MRSGGRVASDTRLIEGVRHLVVGDNTNHKLKEFNFPHSGNGFEFQIEEVVRCLRDGKTESELMPFSLSLMMAEVSDEIRRQGGVRYAVD